MPTASATICLNHNALETFQEENKSKDVLRAKDKTSNGCARARHCHRLFLRLDGDTLS